MARRFEDLIRIWFDRRAIFGDRTNVAINYEAADGMYKKGGGQPL